jgi:hypothetical protein
LKVKPFETSPARTSIRQCGTAAIQEPDLSRRHSRKFPAASNLLNYAGLFIPGQRLEVRRRRDVIPTEALPVAGLAIRGTFQSCGACRIVRTSACRTVGKPFAMSQAYGPSLVAGNRHSASFPGSARCAH